MQISQASVGDTTIGTERMNAVLEKLRELVGADHVNTDPVDCEYYSQDVYSSGFKAAAVPMTLFGVQLVLNVSWSWIFFGMHQPCWAFVEIVILWLAIVATAVVTLAAACRPMVFSLSPSQSSLASTLFPMVRTYEP